LLVMAGVAEALLVAPGVTAAPGERYDVVDDVGADVLALLQALAAEGLLGDHLGPIALTGAAALAAILIEPRAFPGCSLAPARGPEHGRTLRHQLFAAAPCVPPCTTRLTNTVSVPSRLLSPSSAKSLAC